MATIGIILLCVASLGFAVLSARYFIAPAPMVHHSAVMSYDGIDVIEGHERIFSTLYSVIGCVSLALAIIIGALGFFAMGDGGTWARLVVIVSAGILVYGGVLVPMNVERSTGVRMPWRPSIAIITMMILGSLLSFF